MSRAKGKSVDPDNSPLLASAAHELPPAARFIGEKLPQDQRALLKIREIADILWLPKEMSDEQQNLRIVRAVELFESIAPQNGPEAMLALQMLAAHSAAMQCFSRAMIPNQFVAPFDTYLRNGAKLMAAFRHHMETLNKMRGTGHQKVTVEHVNVAPGGQAIVGSVELTQPRAPKARKPKRQAAAQSDASSSTVVPDMSPLAGEFALPKRRVRRA